MKENDVLAKLARSRPATLDPSRLAGSPRQQADLLRIVTGQDVRPGPAAVPVRRRTWRIALPVAGVAVATAVAIVVPSIGSSTLSTATGPAVLTAMATAIQQQSGPPGKYWQQEYTIGVLYPVGTKANPYLVLSKDGLGSSWEARPGGRVVQVGNIDASVEPWRAQDSARWEAAGSPSKVSVVGYPKEPALTIGPGDPAQASNAPSGGTIATIGTIPFNYDDLQKLPADPARLAATFDKDAYHASPGGPPAIWSDGQHESDQAVEARYLFQEATDLLTMPVTPAVRAAAYRLIAGLPGLVSLGNVTDPLGRTGVGFMGPGAPVDGTRYILIVDPKTDSVLASENVAVVKPDKVLAAAGLPANAAMTYAVYTRVGWSDQQIPTK
ncbi:MAG TPA: CU044_5270 family protein [Pseudonocardiaceae bacterium]|jgi:hypothetical protein